MEPIKIFKYRDIEVPILYDDAGQSYFAQFNGKLLNFGSFNTEYEEDLKYLIDRQLDTIYEFPEYPHCKLEWFVNGCGRDIRLVYRTRAIKIFLVKSENEITEVSIEKIKKESLKALQKFNLCGAFTV